jgi:predicted TIM-barrel fold metal-dependent hydrolase
MIIDFHTHFYPDKIAAKAMSLVNNVPLIQAATDGTRGGLEESMKTCGIDISLGLALVNNAEGARGINRWAELNNHSPVFLTGTVHPREEDAAGEIKRIAEAGLKGVKVHPEYQKFRFTERELDQVWEACADHGLFLITHAGGDVGFPEPWHSNPADLLDLHKRIPQLKLVCAHFGSWAMYDDVEKYLLGEDIYIDTSFLPVSTPADPGWIEPDRALQMIRKHGAERVLFGSDSPWCCQQKALRWVKNLGLNNTELESILGGNAAKLLEL